MTGEIEARIRAVAEERVPDPRVALFEVAAEERAGALVLVGRTTEADAVDELVRRLAALGTAVRDEVVRLPDPALGAELFGLVRTAFAPVHLRPQITSMQASQLVLGHRVDLLQREHSWWCVRGEDGYIGWVHEGYLATGGEAWARAWERGAEGEPVVSTGAELLEDGWTVARLPWGARAIRDSPGHLRLPDGRRGEVGGGEVVDVDRLADRFPPRGESIIRSARRWLGTPYVWGGTTPAGADCSGFVQSVFWMHGIALPRDSDQQAKVGAEVVVGECFEEARPGDLVFFAERPGRITHVAISLGGPQILHAALSNGEVQTNDLCGESARERLLRDWFVQVRRVLPD